MNPIQMGFWEEFVMLYESVSEAIGKTPLIRLHTLEKKLGLCAHLYAKVESFNPGGSAKDRPVLYMLKDAEERGLIQPGATLIEPTSGNTGIAIAMLAASRGYKAVLVMPETMSIERRRLIAAYGARIVLTPGAEGMKDAIAKAKELNESTPNSIILSQFTNLANPLAHEKTTGPEIAEDLKEVSAFVAGIGTGGTISGVGKYLKKTMKNVHIVGVEPKSSAVLTTGQSGKHRIQGIGAGFVPETLDRSVVDEIIPVADEDAFDAARCIAIDEGILCGISSGAALFAAFQIAANRQYHGKNVVVLLPDTGERYLSTDLFAE